MAGPSEIVIKGLTRDGRTFRPSDWAQRLATAVAVAGPDRRIHFHPKVRMATEEGVSCVIIDASLRADDPRLFEFLVSFGRNNDLQMEERGGPSGAGAESGQAPSSASGQFLM